MGQAYGFAPGAMTGADSAEADSLAVVQGDDQRTTGGRQRRAEFDGVGRWQCPEVPREGKERGKSERGRQEKAESEEVEIVESWMAPLSLRKRRLEAWQHGQPLTWFSPADHTTLVLLSALTMCTRQPSQNDARHSFHPPPPPFGASLMPADRVFFA